MNLLDAKTQDQFVQRYRERHTVHQTKYCWTIVLFHFAALWILVIVGMMMAFFHHIIFILSLETIPLVLGVERCSFWISWLEICSSKKKKLVYYTSGTHMDYLLCWQKRGERMELLWDIHHPLLFCVGYVMLLDEVIIHFVTPIGE